MEQYQEMFRQVSAIEISLVSCGNNNPVAATTTNAEGYYAFDGLSNVKYGIIP